MRASRRPCGLLFVLLFAGATSLSACSPASRTHRAPSASPAIAALPPARADAGSTVAPTGGTHDAFVPFVTCAADPADRFTVERSGDDLVVVFAPNVEPGTDVGITFAHASPACDRMVDIERLPLVPLPATWGELSFSGPDYAHARVEMDQGLAPDLDSPGREFTAVRTAFARTPERGWEIASPPKVVGTGEYSDVTYEPKGFTASAFERAFRTRFPGCKFQFEEPPLDTPSGRILLATAGIRSSRAPCSVQGAIVYRIGDGRIQVGPAYDRTTVFRRTPTGAFVWLGRLVWMDGHGVRDVVLPAGDSAPDLPHVDEAGEAWLTTARGAVYRAKDPLTWTSACPFPACEEVTGLAGAPRLTAFVDAASSPTRVAIATPSGSPLRVAALPPATDSVDGVWRFHDAIVAAIKTKGAEIATLYRLGSPKTSYRCAKEKVPAIEPAE